MDPPDVCVLGVSQVLYANMLASNGGNTSVYISCSYMSSIVPLDEKKLTRRKIQDKIMKNFKIAIAEH